MNDQVFHDCRMQFPGLQRKVNGQPAIFLDGPAGTQVPQRVIDAIADYLAHRNANQGGLFATSRESDQELDDAHRAVADFLGCDDPDCVAFGPNMTTLTFALSRALARTWNSGDEILVTRLEHDANFSPWIAAANDAGVTIRYTDIDPADTTLDLDSFRSQLTERTRLVAVGCASNATGTVNPVQQICRWARDVGALSFLDAVHFAPHVRIDFRALGCDFLVCSAYKFFGPHMGVMVGRRELLQTLQPYKLRPAPDTLPGRWMTGTQSHEGIAGTREAVEYLADIGRQSAGEADLERKQALNVAFNVIQEYETRLGRQLLQGLAEIEPIRVWGITDAAREAERCPTVAITSQHMDSHQLADRLAQRGIFVWHGNYYALPLTERLGVEPEGMVRIGMVHYNTSDEIDRVLTVLKEIHAGN